MLPVAQFKDFIFKNRLFTADEHILLAVSGGKDSVLMTQLFKLSGFKFSIAHCNFNLRGSEAQRDEAFVKLLAKELDVPFHSIGFQTKVYAKENHISTQMAARELRYNWFEQIRTEFNYRYVALAQHQNDVVETILLNLTRGTGISGLHGILPKREKLIRPLLFLNREEIDKLVDDFSIDFVEDSSNQTDVYARNNIRHNVVPRLKEINPRLENTFIENAKRFVETETLIDNVVEKLRSDIFKKGKNGFLIDIDEINQLNPQHLLLYELLKPFDFSSDVCNEILESLDKQSGTSFYSKTYRITINRDELVLTENVDNEEIKAIAIHQGDTEVSFLNWKLILSTQESSIFTSDKTKAYIDADKLIFPLICRNRQEGDKFMPLGMKNFKLLSDFLINQKVPLPQKDLIPIIINGNGEIIWVAGMRQDERYKLSISTKKVAIFEISN